MLLAALTAALVFAVAAMRSVGLRVSSVTRRTWPRFDLDEAVGFVAEALPDEERRPYACRCSLDHPAGTSTTSTMQGVVIGEGDEEVETRAVLADSDVVARLHNRA